MYCSTTSYDKYIDILAQMTTSDSWLKRAESSKCCCKNINVYSFKYKDELKTNFVNLFIVDFYIRKNLYPCFLYNTCCNRPHSQICYRYHGNHHRGKPCKYWGWCYNTSEGNFPYMAPHWDSTDRLLQEKISRQPLHALNSKSLHVHTCYFSIHVHVVSLLSLCTELYKNTDNIH